MGQRRESDCFIPGGVEELKILVEQSLVPFELDMDFSLAPPGDRDRMGRAVDGFNRML